MAARILCHDGIVEELPVTFQVGLIGSDGWVLASDTLETLDTGAQILASATDKLYEDDKVVVAFSGDDWSRKARDRVIEKIRDSSEAPRKVLTDIGNAVWQEIPEQVKPRARRTLIVAFTDNPKRFYFLELGKGMLLEKRDFVTAGDDQNPAHFFIQRYYVRGAATENTIDQLKLLAAHTIRQASRHNSRVQGLDMIVCRVKDDTSQCERVSDSEIKRLSAESEAIDQQLINLLGVS
jgi:20S proteasome alpha/beta subunit